MANVGRLHSIHPADPIQVDICRSQIQSAGGRYCFSSNIEIRNVDGKDVIIDGVHKAKACWLEGINGQVQYVSENEFLTDQDIRNAPSLYDITEM